MYINGGVLQYLHVYKRWRTAVFTHINTVYSLHFTVYCHNAPFTYINTSITAQFIVYSSTVLSLKRHSLSFITAQCIGYNGTVYSL